MQLEFVHPKMLTDEDIGWITRGCLAVKYQQFSPEGLVRDALENKLEFYRVRGNGSVGIIGVECGNEMIWLYLVAGRNIMGSFDELLEWLKVLARSRGAKRLGAMISSPALERLMERRKLGTKRAAYMVVEDL